MQVTTTRPELRLISCVRHDYAGVTMAACVFVLTIALALFLGRIAIVGYQNQLWFPALLLTSAELLPLHLAFVSGRELHRASYWLMLESYGQHLVIETLPTLLGRSSRQMIPLFEIDRASIIGSQTPSEPTLILEGNFRKIAVCLKDHLGDAANIKTLTRFFRRHGVAVVQTASP